MGEEHLPPHKLHELSALKKIRFALVTVSTSRYYLRAEGKSVHDESKEVAERAIVRAGYEVTEYRLVPDEADAILQAVLELLRRDDVDVVITMGGTGPSPSDKTIETLRPLFEKELEGFGPLFRQLSYEDVGAAALLSNATAGVRGGKAIFCLPGSPRAAKLALERLILPVIGHLLAVRRGLVSR